jgi:hypothetical protein
MGLEYTVEQRKIQRAPWCPPTFALKRALLVNPTFNGARKQRQGALEQCGGGGTRFRCCQPDAGEVIGLQPPPRTFHHIPPHFTTFHHFPPFHIERGVVGGSMRDIV